MPNWKKLVTSGSDASLTSLTLTSLSSQGSEATSVMINSDGVLGTRELGSLAFSSATYDNYSSWNLKTNSIQRTTVGSGGTLDIIPGSNIGVSYAAGGKVTISNSITNNNQLTNGAGYTANTGDITQVNITAGDGLTGDVNTTSGAHTQTIDVDSTVVRTSGTQTVNGNKTFGGQSTFNSTVTFADPVTFDSDLTLDGINSMTESTALVMNGGNEVGFRTLGSNAFNSTSIPTAASDLNLGTSNHVQFHCLGLGQSASGTNGNLRASTIDLSGVTNPQITFNGSSDTGVDMAIKATPEGLDFYEPEDGDKIHFRVLDDTGVSATYGYQVNGTTVISSGRVLQNVSGNISQFTNDSSYLTSESDTLATVTARGATTSTAVTFGTISVSEYIIHASDNNTYMQFDANDSWRVVTGGKERLAANESGIQINESSWDADFRVESNNDTHMLFVDGGNDRLGIGTSTPSSKVEIYASGSTVFDVQGSQGQLFSVVDDLSNDLFSVADISGVPILAVSASGLVEVDDNLHVVTSLGVGTTPSETSGEIRATGDITAFYSSDKRLKDNITPIESPTKKLKQINGVTFDWIPNSGEHSHEGRDVGVIAQEIEKVLPEIVTTRKSGYKAVQYEKIIALLIESNKELLARVEELEEKIK